MTDKQNEVIIKKIMAQDGVPWRKPFSSIGLPCNYNSKRKYNGINLLLFSVLDYPSPYFITARKAFDSGIKVEKGKSVFAIAWIPEYKKRENESPATFSMRKQDHDPNYFRMLFHNLWNISETSEWEKIRNDNIETQTIRSPQDIIDKNSLQYKFQESGSAYCGWEFSNDIPVLGMPLKDKFESLESYYASFFHEMIHCTQKVVKRKRKGNYSLVQNYAAEELVAEIGAWLLCQESGISIDEVADNSAAYISLWKNRITDDPSVLMWAMKEAEKAVSYILNNKKGE